MIISATISVTTAGGATIPTDFEFSILTIGGVSVPVSYAGPTPGFAGLDQVNVSLPLSLRGAGESNVVVTVDGKPSNAVTIHIQ